MEFGIAFQDGISRITLGVHFNVYEAPDEWRYGLESTAVEDDPFYRECDVSSFATFVDLTCSSGSYMCDCLHVITDTVGRAISKGLSKKALVFFDGTYQPFCLYDSGSKTEDYRQFSSEYVMSRRWIPGV